MVTCEASVLDARGHVREVESWRSSGWRMDGFKSRLTRSTYRWVWATALLIGLLSVASAWHRTQPSGPKMVGKTPVGPRAAPAAALPPIEPVRLVAIAPDAARVFNAGVPFSSRPNPAASPFRFAGAADARVRAVDCLAAAVLYEAGVDPTGEKAVAQVVLNRVRHPAFPKTICGVVFQGSERTTGCQFTFTCDGALARIQSAESWTNARRIAADAVDGAVFRPVGLSTHYHTDWIVPYWQSSLDKVAAIGTHLFFRWTGWWGEEQSFRASPDPAEPAIAALASVSPAHREALAQGDLPVAALPVGVAVQTQAPVAGLPTGAVAPTKTPSRREVAALKGAKIRLADPERGAFLLELDPAVYAGSYALSALAVCNDRTECAVYGFLPGDRVPATIDAAATQPRLAIFVYRLARGAREETLWDCRRVVRPSAAQCLPGTAEGRPTVSAAVPNPA